MRFPVDLAALRADPEGFVRAVFGEGGLVADLLPDHVTEPAQMDYATVLVRAALRGLEAGSAGRVTMVEAATGTGKTLAYLTVGCVFALLTGKRLLVSTYTRSLMYQVVGEDARIAVRLANRILGFEGDVYPGRTDKVAVAPRRARSAFVSPTRAAHAAAKLRREGKDALADDLLAYAGLARAALDRGVREGAKALVDDLDGTIEAFDALDPDRAERLREVPSNAYALTAACPAEEQATWRAYDAAAREAACLVVTHAALLIDMSLFGALTGAAESPYALVVVDESHALQRAAASAFSDKISLAALADEAADVVLALREAGAFGFSPEDLARTLAAAEAYEDVCQALLAAGRKEADGLPRERSDVTVGKTTTWYPSLLDLRDALGDIVALLGRAPATDEGEGARVWSRDLARNDRPLQMMLDCIEWRAENGKTGLYLPLLSMTPVRRDPCLQVVPVHGQRIVNRLWTSGVASRGVNRGPMADAVVFTSATMGPSAIGRNRYDVFRSIAWSYGIDAVDRTLNEDLCGSFEPERFGDPRFVFADPGAPYMTSQEDQVPGLTLGGAAYLVHAIATAAGRPNPVTGACRQFVPTKSYEDVALIYESLPEELRERTVARRRGQSLRSALELWRARPDAILITPGAHEGVNEPGLMEHVHIYRLPYDPPREVDGRREHFFNARAEMMTTLRQAIGRGVRRRCDAPTFWITDVRVPPPGPVQTRNRVLRDARADIHLLEAFPARWARRLNAGEILACPPELRRDARAPGPRDEEIAA